MTYELGPTGPRLTQLEIALAKIGNAVYAATWELEDLEHQGKVRGNGHHARQQAALSAQALLYETWISDDDKQQLSPTHPVHNALRAKADA